MLIFLQTLKRYDKRAWRALYNLVMKNTLLAPALETNIDNQSEEFNQYKKSMLEKLDGIEDLLDFVELGGGMHHHERLAARGKMSVRDRIANLLDPDTPFL